MGVRQYTVEECLKNAFECLTRGDTHGRDIWCAMGEKAFLCGSGELPGNTPIPLKSEKIQ